MNDVKIIKQSYIFNDNIQSLNPKKKINKVEFLYIKALRFTKENEETNKK